MRLIALDLDGTLLNSAKELTPRNRAALEAAAAAGIEIVPSTGRFYLGIPEAVRALPFVRYAITINGAQVWDIRGERSLYASDVPL
ncbi:MAG: HAD hydrolase family protein, partial [Oscillospiraceae bacterium]|nr:HAD hydrolase family protein [Oscillospiraceae bacterium]